MDSALLPMLVGALAGVLFLALCLYFSRRILQRARATAEALSSEARTEAENKQKEILVAAQESALSFQEDADRREREIEEREGLVERKTHELERLRSDSRREVKSLERRRSEIEKQEKSLREASAAARAERERQVARDRPEQCREDGDRVERQLVAAFGERADFLRREAALFQTGQLVDGVVQQREPGPGEQPLGGAVSPPFSRESDNGALSIGRRRQRAVTAFPIDRGPAAVQRNEAGDREKAMALLDEGLAISRDLGMRPLMERILSRREILKA